MVSGRLVGLIAAVLAGGWLAGSAQASSIVRLETPLGKIDFVLLDQVAARTTQNFRGYLARGDYDSTFIHRSIAGFVVQGGGFGFDEGYFAVPKAATVPSERLLSNLRGTVAMALVANNRNSATSQWFINSVDNTFLDADFTVFARVPPADMAVVDAINALATEAGDLAIDADPLLTGALTNLPVLTPLDPFVACLQVFPNNADGSRNEVDNCSNDTERIQSIIDRIGALSDSVPERLVTVQKSFLPTAIGSLRSRLDKRIKLIPARTHEVFTNQAQIVTEERDLPARRTARRATLRAEEWAFEMSDDTWRASAVPGLSYAGDLAPRGSSGRRFTLTPDAATIANLLEEGRLELEKHLLEEAFLLARTRVEVISLPPTGTEPYANTVTLTAAGEPKFRATLNRRGDRVTVKGRIPVEGTARVELTYRINGPLTDFPSDVTTAFAGELRFKVSGPLLEFDPEPAP